MRTYTEEQNKTIQSKTTQDGTSNSEVIRQSNSVCVCVFVCVCVCVCVYYYEVVCVSLSFLGFEDLT